MHICPFFRLCSHFFCASNRVGQIEHKYAATNSLVAVMESTSLKVAEVEKHCPREYLGQSSYNFQENLETFLLTPSLKLACESLFQEK